MRTERERKKYGIARRVVGSGEMAWQSFRRYANERDRDKALAALIEAQDGFEYRAFNS